MATILPFARAVAAEPVPAFVEDNFRRMTRMYEGCPRAFQAWLSGVETGSARGPDYAAVARDEWARIGGEA